MRPSFLKQFLYIVVGEQRQLGSFEKSPWIAWQKFNTLVVLFSLRHNKAKILTAVLF